MRRVPATLTIVSVSLALLGACGGKGRPVHGQVARDIDQFVAELTDAQCARVFDCCTAGEVRELLGEASQVTDQASCVRERRDLNQLALALAEDAVGHGTASFDAERARACVAAMKAASCAALAATHLYDYGVDCPSPVIGTLPDQASCKSDAGCRSGHCAGAMSEGVAEMTGAVIDDSGMDLDKPRPQAGVCQPLPAVGEPCPDCQCGPGAHCGYGPEGEVCGGTCIAYLADGEACEDGFECASGGCVDGACGPPTTCDGR